MDSGGGFVGEGNREGSGVAEMEALPLPAWLADSACGGGSRRGSHRIARASRTGELLREQEARGRGRRGEGGRCPLGWWAGPRCGELSLLEEQLASSSVQAASRLS